LEHEWYQGAHARALAERHPDWYDDVRTFADANGKDRALHVRRRAVLVSSAPMGRPSQNLDR
jgi:methylase of polypeptide subunit release factors